MGRLFVFSGPSGTGKTTIVDMIKKKLPDMGYSVSHTSRNPRNGEVHGQQYYFVDKDNFCKMTEAGAFVEWAEVYDNFYGTSFAGLDEQTAKGFDVLLDLDFQGAKNIRKHYADSVLIYLFPPSLEALQKRLANRGTDNEETRKMRLKKALTDMKQATWYDYAIINDDLETAVQKARAIVLAERCRISVQSRKLNRLFGENIIT